MNDVHRPKSDLATAVEEAQARYVAANPQSGERHRCATAFLPGGNTRTVLHYSPFPLTFTGGKGARVHDLDGHTYADFLGDYSAGLYGHSNLLLQTTIKRVVDGGVVLGGPNPYEADLAAELCRRFPSLERVRFCSSGTEANLFALSAARLFTGRPAIMVFHGAYHGGVFNFGQNKQEINAPFPWVLATYNDTDGTLALLEKHARELAAVLIEPMLGSGGVAATREFLAALWGACTRHGIVLAFDEVMTSRISAGGRQKVTGIVPDMTTLGKYLGGGVGLGAFGGRAEIMDRFDPSRAGAVAHAGTFNNNVIAMAAGLTGLRQIYTTEAADRLNAAGDRLRESLNALATRYGAPLQALGVGSIMTIHFHRSAITKPQDWWPRDEAAADRATLVQKLFHLDLIERGQYLARRGYLSLSLPMEESDFARFETAVEGFLASHGELVSIAVDA